MIYGDFANVQVIFIEAVAIAIAMQDLYGFWMFLEFCVLSRYHIDTPRLPKKSPLEPRMLRLPVTDCSPLEPMEKLRQATTAGLNFNLGALNGPTTN